MRPRHAAVISLLLAFSVAAGAFAAERTMKTASHASANGTRLSPALVRRARALDRMELSLRHALRQRPPALPRVPHFKPIPAVTSAASTGGNAIAAIVRRAPAAAPRTIFVRPPAHIVTVHRHGGEGDDGEDEGGGGAKRLATTGKPSQRGHEGGGGDD